ncbi:MAG: hypothetical protein UHN02_01475 [Acutalibacteraceae bacterium]|nr:hypothetical protein [Acutalibacteraceae bacterium]
MEIAIFIIYILALLKFVDFLFYIKRKLLYKPNAVICVLISSKNYLSEIRQSVNRFLDNKKIYKKLILIYTDLDDKQLDVCFELINNIKNVELISSEVINEELYNCIWNS